MGALLGSDFLQKIYCEVRSSAFSSCGRADKKSVSVWKDYTDTAPVEPSLTLKQRADDREKSKGVVAVAAFERRGIVEVFLKKLAHALQLPAPASELIKIPFCAIVDVENCAASAFGALHTHSAIICFEMFKLSGAKLA